MVASSRRLATVYIFWYFVIRLRRRMMSLYPSAVGVAGRDMPLLRAYCMTRRSSSRQKHQSGAGPRLGAVKEILHLRVQQFERLSARGAALWGPLRSALLSAAASAQTHVPYVKKSSERPYLRQNLRHTSLVESHVQHTHHYKWRPNPCAYMHISELYALS